MDFTLLLLMLSLGMAALSVALILHKTKPQDDLFELPPSDTIRAPEMTDPIFPVPEILTEATPEPQQKKPSKPRAPKKPALPDTEVLQKMTKTQLLALALERDLELDRKLTKNLIIETLQAQPTQRGRKKP